MNAADPASIDEAVPAWTAADYLPRRGVRPGPWRRPRPNSCPINRTPPPLAAVFVAALTPPVLSGRAHRRRVRQACRDGLPIIITELIGPLVRLWLIAMPAVLGRKSVELPSVARCAWHRWAATIALDTISSPSSTAPERIAPGPSSKPIQCTDPVYACGRARSHVTASPTIAASPRRARPSPRSPPRHGRVSPPVLDWPSPITATRNSARRPGHRARTARGPGSSAVGSAIVAEDIVVDAVGGHQLTLVGCARRHRALAAQLRALGAASASAPIAIADSVIRTATGNPCAVCRHGIAPTATAPWSANLSSRSHRNPYRSAWPFPERHFCRMWDQTQRSAKRIPPDCTDGASATPARRPVRPRTPGRTGCIRGRGGTRESSSSPIRNTLVAQRDALALECGRLRDLRRDAHEERHRISRQLRRDLSAIRPSPARRRRRSRPSWHRPSVPGTSDSVHHRFDDAGHVIEYRLHLGGGDVLTLPAESVAEAVG